MKILVAIANYGTRNPDFLNAAVQEIPAGAVSGGHRCLAKLSKGV
jgi:hypothetical protein